MLDTLRHLGFLLGRRERLQAAGLLLLLLLGALLEMLGVGAIPAFVLLLTNPGAAAQSALGQRLIPLLGSGPGEIIALRAATALFLLFIVKNLFLVIVTWAQARFGFNRGVAVARRLFAAYLHGPYLMHLQRNSAELLRNANEQAMEAIGAGLMPLLSLALEGFTIAAILLLLLSIEPVTSLAAFIILGGTTVLFLRFVRTRMLRLGERMHRHRVRMIQAVNEGLGSIKVTKTLGREAAFVGQYGVAAYGFAATARTRQVMQEVPRLLLETVAVGGLLAVAALLLVQGRGVTQLVPTLALLSVAVVRMIPSFNRIMGALNSLRYGSFALSTVVRDLRELPPPPTLPRAEPLPLRSDIRLESVGFTYPGTSAAVLVDVSLTIPRGSVVGLMGPTGCGKTTLVDVMLGLLEPSGGRVLIDGTTLEGRVREWQAQIGYVPQDIYLADDTIRRNVAFGIPDEEIDELKVRQAVEAAQVHEFVDRWPAGLDTVVGERGVRLSGGQRQRIGIARALYHDPAVLLLDEATSALDHETEEAVIKAVDALRGRRTIVLIAHRLTTLRCCDQVYALRQGRIWPASPVANVPTSVPPDDTQQMHGVRGLPRSRA